MKVSEDKLEQSLADIFLEGYREARKRILAWDDTETIDEAAHQAGYQAGMSAAAGALYLMCFGGNAMFALFMCMIEEAEADGFVDIAEGIIENLKAGEDCDDR